MVKTASKLTLVGTVHLDPGGFNRLLDLLDNERPKVITVEVSPYAVKFRRENSARYQQLIEAFKRPDGRLPPALAAVAAQLDVPFEFRAATAYAEKMGAKVYRIGDSHESRLLLELLERELMATDNLLTLALRDEPPLSQLIKKEWARARAGYLQDSVVGTDAQHRLVKRNGRLARKIRTAAQKVKGIVVHVGGWEHLHGLSEMLSDLKPEVMLLNPR